MAKTGNKPEMEKKLLEAALECVKSQGIQNTNSYSVTKKLKMSQPSFFYYFASQKEFYKALVKFIVGKNHEQISTLATKNKAKDSWAKVQAYIHGNLMWAKEEPAEADVMFSGFLRCAQDPEVTEALNTAIRGGHERVFGLVAAGMVDGEFQPSLNARAAASALHKAIFGAMVQVHCFNPTKEEVGLLIEGLVEMAVSLLGVKGKRK